MGKYIIKLSILFLSISIVISLLTYFSERDEDFRLGLKSLLFNDVKLYSNDNQYGNIYKIKTLNNFNYIIDEYYIDGIYMQKGKRRTTYNKMLDNIKNLMQPEMGIEKTDYSISVESDTIICCRIESEESPKVFTDFFKFDGLKEKVEIVKLYAKDISLEKSVDLALIIYYGKTKNFEISGFEEE